MFLLTLAGAAAVLVVGTWGLLRLLKMRGSKVDESVVIALAVCLGLICFAALGSGLFPLGPF